MCVCVCVAKPVAVELRCHATALIPLVSVCVSVCLSVTKPCPLYNLITVTDISMKLHTFVKHIETMCHAQEP